MDRVRAEGTPRHPRPKGEVVVMISRSGALPLWLLRRAFRCRSAPCRWIRHRRPTMLQDTMGRPSGPSQGRRQM